MMSKQLIDMIAKRARLTTQKVFQDFLSMQNKLREPTRNIEQLTELKSFMQNLPLDIEKQKIEMNKCFDIYRILEDFNFRFNKEDMDRRWHIFGCPRDTMDLVNKMKKDCEKEKVRFLDEMKEQQEEFRETIENLERTILNFNQHQQLKNHEEVAQIAMDINKCIIQFQEDARKFNSREALFDMDTTDYSKISTMQRDFLPYSNLWITANSWFKNQ